MAQLFSKSNDAIDIDTIARLMCTASKESSLGKVIGATEDFKLAAFRWDFTPLLKGTKGTIEFRQLSGSSNAADTKLWITFAALFIQGAVLYGDTLNGTQLPALESFRALLINGAIQSRVDDYTALNQLFAGKTLLPPGMYNLEQLTPQDLAKLRNKATEKGITVEKFKKLYGYR